MLAAAGPVFVVMPTSATSLRTVMASLESIGLSPDHYHNARVALAAIERRRPALIIHSAQLSDMDAAAFDAAVQRRSTGGRIPTLAIMPTDRTPDQHFGRQTGIMEYICAPFRAADLTSRLQGLLPHAGSGPSSWRPVEKPAVVTEMAEDHPEEPERAAWTEPPAEESPVGEPVPAPAPALAPAEDGHPAETAPSEERVWAAAEPPLPSIPPTSSMPALVAAAIPAAVHAERRIHVVGVGDWGRRAAELFSARGIDARTLEIGESPGMPHQSAAGLALAADRALEEALGDVDVTDLDLFVVVTNLAGPGGLCVASLLQHLARLEPHAGRLLIARLPGLWSGPEERALGLVALNAALQAPPAGVLLIQQAGALGPMTNGGSDPLARLIEIFDAAAGGEEEPLLGMNRSMVVRHFATPGFIGWREITLGEEMATAAAPGWHERLEGEQVEWQPEGYAWGEAQAVLSFVRAPRAWIDRGGRLHFDRLVRAAWDEAAPCSMTPALYAGEPPVAILVSAGMPYPRGVLPLRDTVETDRARLAEKRRAAGALIPLAEDFLPVAAQPDAEPEPIEALADEARGWTVASEAADIAPVEPESEEITAPWSTLPERAPEPIPSYAEPEHPAEEPSALFEPTAPFETPAPPEPEVPPVLSDEPPTGKLEPAAPDTPRSASAPSPEPARSVYRRALALARRILKAGSPRVEIDLGGIRYVLYDLLEIVRANPESILPDVFQPVEADYFERHHVNVAVLTLLVGDSMGETLSHVIDIGTAAMLHDIGMTETRELWDVDVRLPPTLFDRAVRQHPERGYRYLQQIAGMTRDIARVVLEEHERMDGTGYPEGIAGEAIYPGARILAVCDTLEALSHPRPFRENLSPAESLSRLQVLAQYTLDPAIVAAAVDALGRIMPSPDRPTNGA